MLSKEAHQARRGSRAQFGYFIAERRARRRGRPRATGLVEAVRRATLKTNRLPLLCGELLGAFVPCASYVLVHEEVQARPELWALVAGGLVFSATSVFEFTTAAFRSRLKALGFVASSKAR